MRKFCALFLCFILILPINVLANSYDDLLNKVNEGFYIISTKFEYCYFNENPDYTKGMVKEAASEARTYIDEGLSSQDQYINELLKAYIAISDGNTNEAKACLEKAGISINEYAAVNGKAEAVYIYECISICYVVLGDYEKAEIFANHIEAAGQPVAIKYAEHKRSVLLTCIYIKSGQTDKADKNLEVLLNGENSWRYNPYDFSIVNIKTLDDYIYKTQGKIIKEDRVKVRIDDKILVLPEESQPFIHDGRTMVPFRVICENIGADVEWMDETNTVIVRRADSVIKMSIGSKNAFLNDKEIVMDVAPVISDGKTYIPLRYIAELLGEKIRWDGETKTAYIYPDTEGRLDTAMWLNALNANYAMRSGSSLEQLALKKRSKDMVTYAREYLSDGWGATDRQRTLQVVMTLYQGLHNEFFLQMMEEYDDPIFTDVKKRWGDSGIIAWDLCRVAQVTCLAYHAGFITFDEYLNLTIPAAEIMQKTFTCWADMGENYLYGVAFWQGLSEYTDNQMEVRHRAQAHERALNQSFIKNLNWEQRLR